MRSSPVDLADDAEALEAHADRAQVLDAGARDAQRRARDRGEADERADFDVIGADAMAAPLPSVAGPCTIIVLVPIPSIRAPMRHEEVRQVLHVRLGGGVAQDRRALRRDRRHERVLGGRHARLVEEDVGAPQLVGTELEPVGGRHRCAELLEGEEVRVDATAPDDVAAGRRQHDMAAAGQQRARQQDRGADLAHSSGSRSSARISLA